MLTITVTARSGDKTRVPGRGVAGRRVRASAASPPDQVQPVLAMHCPTVLFPYARETIADATMRTGFPPVHLAPINFEALYQQQLAQSSSRRPRSPN